MIRLSGAVGARQDDETCEGGDIEYLHVRESLERSDVNLRDLHSISLLILRAP
jgi:hypothetical protein